MTSITKPPSGFVPVSATIHVRVKAAQRTPGRVSHVRRSALAGLAQGWPPGACEWSISLSDDDELHQLNQQFRGIDKPTDVLSFGGEKYRDGRPITTGVTAPAEAARMDQAQYLGDIAISMDRCTEQALAGGHDLESELALLVVHGTLHLLGYDHDTKVRKARMWVAQARALESIGIQLRAP